MTPRRNDPCACGSGRKYKRCCLVHAAARAAARRRRVAAAAALAVLLLAGLAFSRFGGGPAGLIAVIGSAGVALYLALGDPPPSGSNHPPPHDYTRYGGDD